MKMNHVLLSCLLLVVAGCQAGRVPESVEPETSGRAEEPRVVEEAPEIEEAETEKPVVEATEAEEPPEEKDLSEHPALGSPEAMPEDLVRRLTGIWTAEEDRARVDNSKTWEYDFSWGPRSFGPEMHLAVDFDLQPATLLIGNGWRKADCQIIKTGVTEEGTVLFLFRRKQGPPEWKYVLSLYLLGENCLEMEVSELFMDGGPLPGERYRCYKTDGPEFEYTEDTPEQPVAETGEEIHSFEGPVPTGKLVPEDFSFMETKEGVIISLAGDMEDILTAFGVELDAVPENFYLRGLHMYAAAGKIRRLVLDGESPFITRRGIRIGSTREELLQAYGGSPGKDEYAYYLSGEGVGKTGILAFYLASGEVKRVVMNTAAP